MEFVLCAKCCCFLRAFQRSCVRHTICLNIQALHKLPLVCFDCSLALSQCLCFVCVSVFVISQAVMHRLVCACVLISFKDGKKSAAIFNFAEVAHMSSSCLKLRDMFFCFDRYNHIFRHTVRREILRSLFLYATHRQV